MVLLSPKKAQIHEQQIQQILLKWTGQYVIVKIPNTIIQETF